MDNWSRRDYIPVAVIIVLVVFISYMSRPVEVTVEEPPVELGEVRIAVLDKYNSKYFPETKEEYGFISDMAERDVRQYLNKTGVELDYDVVFYPIEGIFETLESVMQCKKEGIDLIVGMPDGLALDQSLGYMLTNDMTFMCIGATQSFGFTLDDSCFRLLPTDVHQAKPLADTMYELGIRKVIVVTDFDSRQIDAFQDHFHDIGGEVVGKVVYEADIEETEDNKPYIKTLVLDLPKFSMELENLTRIHPSKEVAILQLGWGLPEIMNQTQGYPELLNVTWFSYWGSGADKEELESLGAMMSDVKMLSMVEGLAESELAKRINKEFRDEFGRDMTIVEANIYDGIWILTLSILEERSAETVDLKDRIPIVAADYTGLTGRCELDEVGDRLSFNYTIWGYTDIEGETKYAQFGLYDYIKARITWIDHQ